MLVKAIAPGFLARLHQPGEPPFEIEESQFSKNWMELVEEKRKPGRPKKTDDASVEE